MDNEKFLAAYNASRNGCGSFIRHPLVRIFAYSDGVQECATAGMYWLLDILATETPKVIRKAEESLASVLVTVKSGKADITLSGYGDAPLPWKKRIGWTDMPDGEFNFLISDEMMGDTPFRMILVSEY